MEGVVVIAIMASEGETTLSRGNCGTLTACLCSVWVNERMDYKDLGQVYVFYRLCGRKMPQ